MIQLFLAYYGQDFESRRFSQRYLRIHSPPYLCKNSLHAPTALVSKTFSIGRDIVIVTVYWLFVQRVSFLLVFEAENADGVHVNLK